MNYISVLDEEIENIQHLLTSIPFSSKTTKSPEYFLNVYKIQHEQLVELNDESTKFPIDSGKLLKLGISLGNVIKSLQIDEELYEQQHQQQKTFLNNLNNLKSTTNRNDGGEPNPFNESDSKPIINGIPTPQPVYQTKFIRNLQSVLKNFDIGASNSKRVSSINNQDIRCSQSSSTLDQFDSDPPPTVNSSPIKLNSKQLLIEKLEINIKLDCLFIYKIIFKLILQIFHILQDNLKDQNMHKTTSTISRTSSHSEFDENSSIFSTTSLSSSDSNLAMTSEEYLKVLKQVLNRILTGLIKPFVKMILREVVENLIQNDFSKLLNSL